MRTKALTLWQPWASLIIGGAKKVEYRKWDFTAEKQGFRGVRYIPSTAKLVGQRIVIHAGARKMRAAEIIDILDQIRDGVSALDADTAVPILEPLLGLGGRRIRPDHKLEYAAGLGTVELGIPHRPEPLRDLPDSYLHDHHIWAWPLKDVRRFEQPVHCRGHQGFWNWPFEI